MRAEYKYCPPAVCSSLVILTISFNEVEYKEKRLRTIYNSSKEFCCVTEQGSGGVAAGECGFTADFFF